MIFVFMALISLFVRCYKYSGAGLNRLDAPRPKPFITKMAFQAALVLICLGLAVLGIIDEAMNASEDNLGRIIWHFIQMLIWMMLIGMMHFDYKRALPTACYVHKMLWFYAFIYNTATMVFHIINATSPLISDAIFWCLATRDFCCLSLCILVLIWPNDTPYTARNYIRAPHEAVKVGLIERSESCASFQSDLLN